MAVRPPRPRRPRRPAGRERDIALIIGASLVLVVFGLRIVLAALGVETWTTGWRLVATPTMPFVEPFETVDFLTHTPLGRLTLADMLVGSVVSMLMLMLLASLTIRRAPN